MENECVYKHKCNVSKVLIATVISFTVVCGVMVFMLYQFHQQVNKSFQNSITKTAEIISNIKIENQKNKQIIISEELSKAITKVNQNEYENFLRNYYEMQNNWLNIWLTIMALLLGFLGLIVPLCFLKFYESKKEEFGIVIRDVEKKKETMTQDLDEVKKYVEKAKESEKRINAIHYYTSAGREMDHSNYNEALKRINEALALYPKNISFMQKKAEILNELDQYEEAKRIYEDIMQMKDDVNVYNGYGVTLLGLMKYEEAIEIFTKAINHEPKNSYLISNRGIAYFKRKEFQKALMDFQKAFQLSSSDKDRASVLYNTVECYLGMKDFCKALDTLKKYQNMIKDAYILDEDKDGWLDYLKEDLGKKEVSQIANLINSLKIKKRTND